MRKYGQHFLVNERVIDSIVGAVASEGRHLVEIGPGRGALTEKLLLKPCLSFTLIEIDPLMRDFLMRRFDALKDKIILSDFLKFDLNALPRGPVFFVSNLPYIDAADILDKVLSYAHFAGAVFMFQKEQARRILSHAGQAEYGPLSVLTQLRADVQPLLRVGRGCFNPPPKVESEVLQFRPCRRVLAPADFERFRRLVKDAFAHKRKTLFNSLSLSGYDKTRLSRALAQAHISASERAQEISLQNFLFLNDLLKN